MPERRKIARATNNHLIDDCPQAATIATIGEAIKRVDARGERMEIHGERTALALEEIVRQGVMVQNHEKRLDKTEDDINHLGEKIRVIEHRHEIDHGKEEVLGEQKKFWTEVKLRLVSPLLVTIFFFWWVSDKYNIGVKIAKLFKEMRG